MLELDLYNLLENYVAKGKSPYVHLHEFLDYMEKYAARKASHEPEWNKWVVNAAGQFHAELPQLTADGRCMLLADHEGGRLFVPSHCREIIKTTYEDIDSLADSPFPNEETMELKLPSGYAQDVHLSVDMGLFFDKGEEASGSDDNIIIMQFPQHFGSALLLASMIPRRLMEMALLKIRCYLQTRNNKDFVLNKLIGQMQGKEKILRDIIERIMVRPLDCLTEMERSADFPYLFWTYFCPLVKNDITQRNELLTHDLTVLQAVCIIEVFCSFYRNQAAKKREIDAAFMSLEVQMDRSPYRYNLEEIINFHNDRGISLLDIYTPQDLEEYIQNAISENTGNALPKWLLLQGETKNERWYIKKERYPLVCTRMVYETQQRIKAAISKRWSKLVRDYLSEPAMTSDAEFERLLIRQTRALNPLLMTTLEDPKLFLACEEANRERGSLSQPLQIFRDGRVLPFNALYGLQRRVLLSDVKLKLPFWYSIPFLVAIIRFFKKLFGIQASDRVDSDEVVATGREPNEFQRSVRQIESIIVPPGRTLDEYLAELESRWIHLLDKNARSNLLYDVQSLLKDHLRTAMKVYKLKRITREGLKEMVSLIATRNPALSSMADQESLRLYMELYMLKLLLTRRM